MPIASAAAVRTQIAAGNTHPVYLILGDDEVEKSALAHEFENLVEEGLRAFNVERFYGSDAKADDVMDAVNTLPMMVPRRVFTPSG